VATGDFQGKALTLTRRSVPDTIDRMAELGHGVRTVLAVDDDAMILAAVTRSMGRKRTVITTSSPDEAIDAARTTPPDLAIVDLRIGQASGIDLARRLKSQSPETVIVLISGYLTVDTTVRAMRAGADFVMSKPITATDILRRIDESDDDGDDADLDSTPTLADAQNEHIARVLADCGGCISEAARRLGIHRSSLQRRLRKMFL
jgi:two-component system response regulator RegA